MNHITSPNEPYPTATSLSSSTTSHTQHNFRISSRKLPISKSGPIDAMSARLGIPVPEMIFGDNLVSITHVPTSWAISFRAEDALDAVDKTGENMLQVAYARDWSASRERTSAGIREVVRPFDWSYSSTYKGGVCVGVEVEKEAPPSVVPEPSPAQPAGKENEALSPTDSNTAPTTNGTHPSASIPDALQLQPTPTAQIPLELLRRRDPILFADEVVLYESELDDNGVSMFTVKVRVMPARMLLLARLYMRLDGVVVRVRDTRVYVDFATDEVIREYTAREDGFENVKRSLLRTGLMPDGIIVAMRDSNQVANLLPVVEQSIESVKLS